MGGTKRESGNIKGRRRVSRPVCGTSCDSVDAHIKTRFSAHG